MNRNLGSRVVYISILFGILISTVAVNIVSAANDSLAVDDSKDEQQQQDVQLSRPTPTEKDKTKNVLSSSASGYCSSFGGSTSYESISSVTYTQNPSGTMTITVDVYIANPTGCTYGNSCPEYDESPEYVNVWVDWNGNNQFESNEKVIDDALTGYSNLNYHGTMTTSKIVTIPPNAVSSTLMRANLGWGSDPDDPCTYSWTWGNVVDKKIELTSIKVVQLDSLDDVAIKDISDPVWKKQFDTNGNLVDVAPKEDDSVADDMKSGRFKVKTTLDAFPNKPSWNPNVNYEWNIPGSTAGTGSFEGWSGTFDVIVPQKVGVYTLQLKFTFKDSANNIVGSQSIDRKLYVTYDSPILSPPKEIWLKKATSWAAGAGNPKEVASVLTSGIYSTSGWVYRDGATNWQSLVEDSSSKGNCVSFSNVWDNLNKVLGVGGSSIKQTDGISHFGFVTKPATALDSQKGNAHRQGGSVDRWVFGMHQVGNYNSMYYDPTFNGQYAGINDFIDWHLTGNKGFDSFNGIYYEATGGHKVYPKSNGPPWGDYEYHSPSNPVNVSANNGANFTGNHFESGIDTDGDGLFNSLSTNVEVDVSTAGNYSIFGSLIHGDTIITSRSSKDSAGFAGYYLSSDAGLRNVTLNFSGQDIYDSGINGNYTLDLFLLDENGTVIDNKSFNTSAYDHAIFGEIPAKIENVTDYGEDTNDDGLYNYLSTDISIKAINPTKYSLQGALYSNETLIATNYTTADLINGTNTEKLKFNGSDIWKSKFNGPYTLDVTLYDENNQQIDIKEYKTVNYNYEAFQRPAGSFRNIYSDSGMDTDSDGLYNFLATKADVNIEVSGNYTVVGWLSDSKGDIVWDEIELNLNAGIQSVQLNFDGDTIYKHETNGPYELSYIALFDSSGNLIDSQHTTYTTLAYKYTDFQKPENLLVKLTGKYNSYGTDTNGDGLYDYLTVDVEVIPKNAGNVVASARLMDSSGEEITWANNTTGLEADQPQNIQLNFDGRYVYGDLTNGPYYVKDVYVYHTGDPTLPDYASDAHTTDAYNYSEFEKSGIVTGTVMDIGLPVKNALISVNGWDLDYTNSAGKYNLVMLQNSNYTVNIDASGYTSWKIFIDNEYVKDGNSVDVDAAIGKVTYVNFTQGTVDIEPPSSITNLQSNTGIAWINWTWNNPIDPDFDHTEIYLNGSFQTNTSTGYFNATGLKPETSYTLSTRTVDNSGNVNQTWVNSTGTTEKASVLPVANFSANPIAGIAPLNVKFTDTSTGTPAAWIWDFGDESKSLLQNPTHKYSKAGVYTVNLTVKNAAGKNTVTKTEYIKVTTKPVANFTSSVTSGKAPLKVAFTDTSTGSSTSWFWNFGDGSKSFLQTPTHKYSKAGKYTVSLTVKNAEVSNTVTKTDYIKVIAKPVANFTSSVTSGKTPLNVAFTDTSTGTPAAWIWDFGDGSKSFFQNPTHKYSKVGIYTVSLTVKNAAGSNTVTKTEYIKVITKPVANFTSNVTSGKAPLTVAFTDTSTGIPTKWKWSFGDGTTSTEQNPEHQYLQEGSYKITLTVSNAAGGNTITKTNYIIVTTNTRPGIYSENK